MKLAELETFEEMVCVVQANLGEISDHLYVSTLDLMFASTAHVSTEKIPYGVLRVAAVNINTPQHFVWCNSYKLVDVAGVSSNQFHFDSANQSVIFDMPQLYPGTSPRLVMADMTSPFDFLCEN